MLWYKCSCMHAGTRHICETVQQRPSDHHCLSHSPTRSVEGMLSCICRVYYWLHHVVCCCSFILSSQNFLIYFPYLLLYRSQTSSCTTQYASWWSRRRSLWKESSSFMLMLREKSISLTHSVTSMRLCGLIGNIAYRQCKLKVGVACMHACTNDRRCIA